MIRYNCMNSNTVLFPTLLSSFYTRAYCSKINVITKLVFGYIWCIYTIILRCVPISKAIRRLILILTLRNLFSRYCKTMTDIQTSWSSNKPTDQPTDIRGHREVTLPMKIKINRIKNVSIFLHYYLH